MPATAMNAMYFIFGPQEDDTRAPCDLPLHQGSAGDADPDDSERLVNEDSWNESRSVTSIASEYCLCRTSVKSIFLRSCGKNGAIGATCFGLPMSSDAWLCYKHAESWGRN